MPTRMPGWLKAGTWVAKAWFALTALVFAVIVATMFWYLVVPVALIGLGVWAWRRWGHGRPRGRRTAS